MKKKNNIANKLKDKFFRDDELIESLTEEYLEKYPNLKKEYIHALVKDISGLATSTFDNWRCRDSDCNKKVIAENMKEAMYRTLNESEKKALISGSYILYEYVQGQNNRIEQCFSYANLSNEDPSLYQELVIDLARDRAEVVVNTVLNWLPFAVRYASDTAQASSSSPDSVATSEDTNHTGKKSFVEMVAKKPRLTFEEDSIKKKNLSFQEELEGPEQNGEFCSVSNDETTSNSEIFANQNIDSNQQSITAIAEVEETGEVAKENNNKADLSVFENDNSLLNPQLIQFYTWLSELPGWLQKQILNSSAVQALIEAAEQISTIYDIKSIPQAFAEFNAQEKKYAEEQQYDQEIAYKAEQTLELVDLSYTLDADLMPVAAIMHDSAPAFGEFLPDPMVHWF